MALAAGAFAHVFARSGTEALGATAGDVFEFFYPMRDYANAEMRGGRLPLWNPQVFCGMPMHAEGQVGLFCPTFLATFFLPATLSLNLSAFVHFAAAGVFLYLYLRAAGLSPFASFFGGFAYQFSAATAMRLFGGLVSMMPALALVPALLFVWEKWRETGRRTYLAWGALAYGCLILAGHPQTLFYSSLYVGWHVAFGLAALGREKGARPALKSGLGFAAIVALGIGVGAVQMFPTLDFVPRSSRSETTYEFCTALSLLPESSLTLLAPGFFGDALRTTYWGRDRFWEMDYYIGVLPLAFALATILRPGSNRWAAHAWAVPVLVAVALGRYTPVFGLLYRWVPLFDSFRGPCKLVAFAQTSLCVLAAVGVERLAAWHGHLGHDSRAGRPYRIRLFTGCALAAMVVLGVVLLSVFGATPDAEGSAWQRLQEWRFAHRLSYDSFDRASMGSPAETWRAAAFWLWRATVLAAGGLVVMIAWPRLERRRGWGQAAILAVLLPDLFLFTRSYLVTFPVPQVDALRPFAPILAAQSEPFRVYTPTVAGNPTLLHRLDNVRGHTGLFLGRMLDYSMHSGRYRRWITPFTERLPSTITEQMVYPNVRYVIMPPQLADDAREIEELARTQDLCLYRLRAEMPRAYFALSPGAPSSGSPSGGPPSGDIVHVRSREEALRTYDTNGGAEFPVRRSTIVEIPGSAPLPPVGSPEPGDSIRFARRESGRVALDTMASGPRLLVLLDAYDKDWRCRLDGVEDLHVFPVNLAFRGVVVPGGAHRVEFTYRPTAFYLGSFVSVLSLVVLLAVVRDPRRSKSQAGKKQGTQEHGETEKPRADANPR